MRWIKKGCIFSPSGAFPWARTHAHLPTPELTDRGLLRVYFAALNEARFGQVGYVDLNPDNPMDVLHVSSEPVLGLGELGTFDDCGAVPSCAVRMGTQRYLYYIGFQRAQRVPYLLFTGLAIDDGEGNFKRFAKTPVLDRTPLEPFSRSAPFILREGSLLRMWYWSCRKWSDDENGVHYSNVIRHATSADGLDWHVHDHICIEPDEPDEYSIGRPCVINTDGTYRMWYSARSFSKRYKIGYAESSDGLVWERKDDEAGISVSETGWDSEMICYPYVTEFGGRLYMFYNGNGHGATGFGYAILEE